VSVKNRFDKEDKAAILLVAFFMAACLITPFLRHIAVTVCSKPDDSPYDQIWKWIHKPSLTDWLLVFVGLCQLVVFRKQMFISREQAEISDRQIKLIEESERPLVLVQTFRWAVEGWKWQTDKSVFPGIVISLANFGSGVALADYCRIGLFIGVNPPELYASNGHQALAIMRDEKGGQRKEGYLSYYIIRRGLMPHSDEWEIELRASTLTVAQKDELGTGHQKAWIDAVAFYTDIRGGKHETFFRYIYDPQSDIFVPDDSAPNFNRHT
jgi:hypothetical protein